MKLTECPLCGSRKLRSRTGGYPAKIGKKRVLFPGIQYCVCEACGERFLSDEAMIVLQEYRLKKRKVA